MLCKSPYMINGMACPCTKCLPCRFNRRRMWTHRIVLESLQHSESSFLTLTYDDDHLPAGGTLVPRDVQLFIKRLRKFIEPLKLRYFFVGEYGDKTWRPHYHAALFGIGTGFAGIIKEAWPAGHVYLGDLTLHSAQYVAGYTVKKMTAKDDARLNGLYPEFARMSLRPGIGALSVPDIVKSLQCEAGAKYVVENGDIPRTLSTGGKTMPIGRYMRRKILEGLGLYDFQTGEIGTAPARTQILEAYKIELQSLRTDTQQNTSLKEVIVTANAQKVLNMEKRAKIFQSERIL